MHSEDYKKSEDASPVFVHTLHNLDDYILWTGIQSNPLFGEVVAKVTTDPSQLEFNQCMRCLKPFGTVSGLSGGVAEVKVDRFLQTAAEFHAKYPDSKNVRFVRNDGQNDADDKKYRMCDDCDSEWWRSDQEGVDMICERNHFNVCRHFQTKGFPLFWLVTRVTSDNVNPYLDVIKYGESSKFFASIKEECKCKWESQVKTFARDKLLASSESAASGVPPSLRKVLENYKGGQMDIDDRMALGKWESIVGIFTSSQLLNHFYSDPPPIFPQLGAGRKQK